MTKKWEITGKKPKELEVEEAPESLLHVLRWWRSIRIQSAITWQEIRAWSELTGNNPRPDEARLILDLDTIYNNAAQAR